MTWTNLHEACENGRPDDIVKEAHEHPESILSVEDHGWTPLHCAVWRNPNVDAIKSLLQACPEAASVEDVHGNTPLHVAVCSQVMTTEMVQLLLEAHPDALATVNREGLLPLHMALRFAPLNDDVIRLLVKAYSLALDKCIKACGTMGDPAPYNHTGHDENQNHAIFDPTGGMHKDATDLHYGLLSQQTRDGAFPLHIAVQSGASLQTLELLIQKAPEVLVKSNKFGETPLHVSLKKGVGNDEQAMLLLQHDHSAATLRDDEDNLPIHIAAMHGCSPRVAESLVELQPEVIHEVNKHGLTPMACAIHHNLCTKEVLEILSIKDFRTIPPTDFM
ncbi:hypothetical protein MPSEU_000827300 [Mayamaea pseudoterrestris]|nr:hypothetical protein MPSEU_000827300 [Mayamaea pseudoterrestris]